MVSLKAKQCILVDGWIGFSQGQKRLNNLIMGRENLIGCMYDGNMKYSECQIVQCFVFCNIPL